MSLRFLAAMAGVVLAIGLADARAQDGTGSDRKSPERNAAASAGEPASSGDEAAAPRDSSATKDPFDSAASQLKSTGTKAVGADGKGDPSSPKKGKLEKATFGAGCFWHVEEAFEWLPGVKSAVSGYAGGSVRNPSYEEVHEGVTGHAEVVQVEYDPAVISYEQLLTVFWKSHDPTQWNRQGPDVGTQYRSAIFYHNPEQRDAALKSYRELTAGRVFPAPIVTQLMPMKAFYRAEEYHQNYYGGKDGTRVPGTTRTRRTRKPAARGKTAATARQDAARKAAGSAKRPVAGDGTSPSSQPGRGGEAQPES